MAPTDLQAFENQARQCGYRCIAGVDEVGRGPLAGPVVSAAVVLPDRFEPEGITDSKRLSPGKRFDYYLRIYREAVSVGIGIVDNADIDRMNILQASLLSMVIAVDNLHPEPDYLLIDGIYRIPTEHPQEPIPKGDRLSVNIASASIVAKVTRDRLMERYHLEYPDYGFQRNKGYPTKAHREAIARFGSSPIHRKSFRGVSQYRFKRFG